MLDLTAKDSPVRVALSEKYARLAVSHPDYLLVVCLVCGGTKSITLHKQPGQCDLPTLFACYCDAPTFLPAQEDAHASTP